MEIRGGRGPSRDLYTKVEEQEEEEKEEEADQEETDQEDERWKR